MSSERSVPTVGSTDASRATAHADARRDLRRLEGLFAECAWPERRAFKRASTKARDRALEILEGQPNSDDLRRAALNVAAAELFRGLTAARAISSREAPSLARQIEEVTGISSIMLAREVLRAPELLTAAPDLVIEVVLMTLVAFAPLRSVSLWTQDARGGADYLHHAGDGTPSRRVSQRAQALLSREHGAPSAPSARSQLLGLRVGDSERPLGVLVGSARPGMRESCQTFFEEAVPMLAAVLERNAMRAGRIESERVLVESSERKLTRLGFDLHDGPIQDVALLAEDLRLFRDQLERVLAPLGEDKPVLDRVEDLDARVVAIDAELRRLSSEVQAASVRLQKPFRAALRERVQAFTARTSIEPRVTLVGAMKLSASQQIALLNTIQEALGNIREHARAGQVEIVVSASERGVQATVSDDGRGFDVERALLRAARQGRMGLLAMHERARLLGGECRVESRPGGPTTVSVALERWPPRDATGSRATSRKPAKQRRNTRGSQKKAQRRRTTA